MKRSDFFKIIWVISVAYLLISAVSLRRDYQDSWTLQGLEIPFACFAVTFILAFFSERKVVWQALIAVVSSVTFTLVPDLKYTWFMGVAIDQNMQYSLANNVLTTGHIMTSVPVSSFSQYTSVPLLHMLFASSSILLNSSLVNAVKFAPLLFSPLFCLTTYAIVSKLSLDKNGQTARYALFLSAIPISAAGYAFGGVTFGIPLLLVVLFLLFSAIEIKDRRYLVLFVFFLIALAAAHSATSIMLGAIFSVILIVQKFPFFSSRIKVPNALLMLPALIALVWIVLPAFVNFETIVNSFAFSVPKGTTPTSDYITPTFFELLKASPIAGFETFLLYYGADFFLLALGLIGLLLVLRHRQKMNNLLGVTVIFFVTCLLILVFSYVIKLGPTRILTFIEILLPIFAAVTLLHLPKKKVLIPLFLGAILVLSAVQFYKCQPLEAPASLVDHSLSSNVPLGYVVDVNSIYQRQVVTFALNYFDQGRITCDYITYDQFMSVANSSFVSSHLPYQDYPIGENELPTSYQLFIIHLPGVAGGYNEPAPIRSTDVITQQIENSSVVYSNGQSFALLNH